MIISGQLLIYLAIYFVLMCGMAAGGYVAGTERRYDIEQTALDYDYWRRWMWDKKYTTEQQIAAYEAVIEVIHRLK